MVAVSVSAQIKIGITAGANYNIPSYAMSGDSLAGAGSVKSLGGHGGLHTYVNLAGKDMTYGVQVDLQASTRSHNTSTVQTTVVNPDINYYRESFAYQQMIYLDLPIQFRYNLILQKGRYGDANMLSFYAGPQASFALAKNYEVEHTFVTTLHGQQTIRRENSTEATFKYKPLEVGLSAGLQFELKVGFRVGFRYYRSFMNLADHESLKITNQMMMAYVGFNLATIEKRRK